MADEPATHKGVTLAVAWPVETHTDGSYVITQEGTEVPPSKVKSIIEGAASTGVRVYEVEA